MTGVQSLAEAKDLSSSLFAQTGSEADWAASPVGTRSSFSGDKARPGHDSDHLPLSSANIKNG
jgi:hypothetical protein